MQVIPVLDLLDGVVVRGVAGRRETYRPVESCLADGAEPLQIARAFREQLGLDRLYVADLDAILHRRPNLDVVRRLADDRFETWVDPGVQSLDDARTVIDAGATTIIAGLETLPGPETLGDLLAAFGPERVIFSLDMQAGRALTTAGTWSETDPFAIGLRAVAEGVGRMIVLDLARVGVGEGVGTAELCDRLASRCPGLVLMTGGGIRREDDLRQLCQHDVSAVLVASALHSGAVPRSAIEAVQADEGSTGSKTSG